MALERLDASLDRFLEKAGLAGPLRAWRAISLWSEVVGEPACHRSRAVNWEAGRLIVEVDTPAWTSQLMFLKRDIINRLNARIGEFVIREIQFIAARGGRRDG
jgi:predicted nucleic acid-binding Zn ribbon protein